MEILTILLVLIFQDVRGYDTPNDAGGSITVEWEREDAPLVVGYEIWRSQFPDTGFTMAGSVVNGIWTSLFMKNASVNF
ncbi:hypothetical protein LR066_01930 [candidate division WOR-3 bacterium]|nr:hypothetical protein [candidate division WOR-3 bacterium]